VNRITAKYEDGIDKALENAGETAAYLTAALEEGTPEVVMMALRDVVRARRARLSSRARATDVERVIEELCG